MMGGILGRIMENEVVVDEVEEDVGNVVWVELNVGRDRWWMRDVRWGRSME